MNFIAGKSGKIFLATLFLLYVIVISEASKLPPSSNGKYMVMFNGHDTKNGTKKTPPCAGMFIRKKWILTQTGCFCDVDEPKELNYLKMFPEDKQQDDFKDYLNGIHFVKNGNATGFVLLELNKELPVPIVPIELNDIDEDQLKNTKVNYFKFNDKKMWFDMKEKPVEIFKGGANFVENFLNESNPYVKTLKDLIDITPEDIHGAPIIYKKEGKPVLVAMFTHVMYTPVLYTTDDWNVYVFLLIKKQRQDILDVIEKHEAKSNKN